MVDELGISWYTKVFAVWTPRTWAPANPLIDVVDNPEIIILSPSFKEGAVEMNAETVLPFFQVNIVLSKTSTVVSIEVTSFPAILFTVTLKPPPFVPVLSNTALSPIS